MGEAKDSQKGQMTISPPSKVKVDPSSTQILASGFDTLNLTIDVFWKNSIFFSLLSGAKERAKETRKDEPLEIPSDSKNYSWKVSVKLHGSNGYEWLISNKEFTLKIGSWRRPQSKPSIVVEIRSETLWHLGPEDAIENIILLLLSQGGSRIAIKPSRVDLCVDILLPEELWGPHLIEYATTRSTYIGPHYTHRKLTGISISKGKISARLYDKPLEIRQQSKKFWMYDIWGIKEVPAGYKIIRVEFQLRREMQTELSIKTLEDLFPHCNKIWAYCAQKWLKFQTNPGKHHTQRKTLPWWKVVQNGFLGVQDPEPLVRSKAIQHDIDASMDQAIGHLRAIICARQANLELDSFVPAEIEDALRPILRKINHTEETKADFSQSVKDKNSKYIRMLQRHLDAEKARKSCSFPTDL